MNILDKIIAHKKQEVAQLRKEVQIENLVKSPNFNRTPLSLKKSLLTIGSSGIIAEFKRQSPSKGIINDKVTIEEVTITLAGDTEWVNTIPPCGSDPGRVGYLASMYDSD